MTQIKEGLARLAQFIQETTADTRERKGDASRTPQAAESCKNCISKALARCFKLLEQNFPYSEPHFSIRKLALARL